MKVGNVTSTETMLDHLPDEQDELIALTPVGAPESPLIKYSYLFALVLFASILGPIVTVSHKYLPSAMSAVLQS